MFWGYTPALDLNKELNLTEDDDKTVNILLIGSIDARHLLKTLSQSYKYQNVKYNFYVADKWIEQTARQVLFLNIVLEAESELGLFEKLRIFMELYGNSIIRPPVQRYLHKKAKQFINAITDDNYLGRLMPNFNFNEIMFRERDYMENIFKFWSKADSEFNIQDAWDRRVRKALGTRYDSRKGVFDCDYHFRLCEVGANIIFSREYINWRESGIAFTWLETDGCKPNLTLAAGVLGNGIKLHHQGYLGDITVGPYIAYGIDCDNPDMLTKVNHEYKHRATDVTEYNLAHMIYQITKREKMEDEKYSIGSDVRCAYMKYPDLKLDLHEQFEVEAYDPTTAPALIEIPNVMISFLSVAKMKKSLHKANWQQFFDLVVVSNENLDDLSSDVMRLVKIGGKVVVETRKFFINLTKEAVKEYEKEIQKKAADCSLKLEIDFNASKDAFVRFTNKSNK